MQLNDITLAVDLLNTGITTDLDITKIDLYQNRSVYMTETHEPGMRDLLTIYRTAPKPTSTFKGVRKGSIKFTMDKVVDDPAGSTVISPFIFEVSCSTPVGVTAADAIVMRQRAIALLDNDDFCDKLFRLGII